MLGPAICPAAPPKWAFLTGGLRDCVQVARAREAAAEAKLRAEMEASQRRLLLLQRLERAERSR